MKNSQEIREKLIDKIFVNLTRLTKDSKEHSEKIKKIRTALT
jgi:hypothetical protein